MIARGLVKFITRLGWRSRGDVSFEPRLFSAVVASIELDSPACGTQRVKNFKSTQGRIESGDYREGCSPRSSCRPVGRPVAHVRTTRVTCQTKPPRMVQEQWLACRRKLVG